MKSIEDLLGEAEGEQKAVPPSPDGHPYKLHIEDVCDMMARSIPRPPQLIEGFMHRGEKAMLGGASKSYKSWASLHIAMAVASGRPIWGRNTIRDRVLFLNLEIPDWHFRERVEHVRSACNAKIEPGQFFQITTRGKQIDATTLRMELARYADKGLGLIVVDPLYKLTADLDENSVGDMGKVLAQLEAIASETGAGILIPAHFAKGNSAAKEAIDRISGSGVFARDADAIHTITKHQQADCYTLASTLRSMPPRDDVVLRWQFPLFSVDPTLDPSELRQQPTGRGREPRYTPRSIADCLPPSGATKAEWERLARNATGVSRSTFHDIAKRAEQDGLVVQKGLLFMRHGSGKPAYDAQ
jgi:hypothetical protein